MNNLKNILIIIMFFVTTNCNESNSDQFTEEDSNEPFTEQELKEFKCKCLKTDTFYDKIVLFTGFDNNEFNSVLIKEYNDETLLDSFKIHVSPSGSPWQKEHKQRIGTISRTMNVKYNYHFIIPGQKPYVLSDMKMILWPECLHVSKGYGCKMGDFRIDGVRYEQVTNPNIKKRNWKDN